jgi:hypothetical protein
MKPPFLRCCIAGVTAATAVWVTPAAVAGDESAAQVVGGIEAMVFVCTPLDAKSVRPGLDMLQRATDQRKLDLVAIRRTDAYRGAYNAEVNRLLSLPTKDRLGACQHAF